ncbi:hypothetical protein [Haliscomenobacter hydrossis]|uniref:Uncharacterized protein n=1 Tax=Haliscomenobacter hydrossis (strain ATCC 27775 / DSM 1100 / LMG 10767 / O) TaxID=760192 RepID=F4KYL7_HALH1|nr:hypothetical protein [Haliscomenobacter hydrossis]AEE50423.1 hypothetical protein Halhy_2550 [Haliscomenobacter hydrossis DSM 1100]
MEKFISTVNDHQSIEILSPDQMNDIEGGSFWYDLAWTIGYVSHKVADTYNAIAKTTQESGFMASPVGAGSKGAGGK